MRILLLFLCFTCQAFEGITLSPESRLIGPAPVSTGNRQVFYPSNYLGTAESRITQAGESAYAVGGSVILDKVYEVTSHVTLFDGVMYTGGGLRRALNVRTIVSSPVQPSDNWITVQSVEGLRIGNIVINTNSSAAGTIWSFVIDEIDTMNSRLIFENPIGVPIPSGAYVFNEFPLAKGVNKYLNGVVIDSMLFDGNIEGNSWTHDWRFNNTMLIRGSNIVRNCYFFDTPSENITCCGGGFIGNIAFNLAGSFIHKGCDEENAAPDEIQGNYVGKSNLKGDKTMGHSEAVITLSLNSRDIHLTGNIFRDGKESVIGNANADALPIYSTGNYFSSFPRFVSFQADGNPDFFHSINDLLDNVPINLPTISINPFSSSRGRLVKMFKIGTVADAETMPETISVSVDNSTQGISITNITVDKSGVVRSEIFIGCSTAIGLNTVLLKIEDTTHVSSFAAFPITIASNTPPSLGRYTNSTVNLIGSMPIPCSIVPYDNGKIVELIAIKPIGFLGDVAIDSISGLVTVSNASPIGIHRFEIRATDNCGESTSKFFNLTVTN